MKEELQGDIKNTGGMSSLGLMKPIVTSFPRWPPGPLGPRDPEKLPSQLLALCSETSGSMNLAPGNTSVPTFTDHSLPPKHELARERPADPGCSAAPLTYFH